MDAKANYREFREELEDRRMFGQVQYSICCFGTLSPTKLPNAMTEMSKFRRHARRYGLPRKRRRITQI